MIDRMLRERLVDAYMMAIPLITLNVVWFVTSLPLVTAIPAAAALFYATNQMAHGKPASWNTFFEGFRLCFRRSWAWGALNLLVAAAALAYLYIFSQYRADWTTWASGLVVAVIFIWLAFQLHTFPLTLEQEQPRLRLAFRNAAIMLLKRPLFSFGVTAALIALAVGSTLILPLTWPLITGSLCAYLANAATLHSIERITGKRALPVAPDNSPS